MQRIPPSNEKERRPNTRAYLKSMAEKKQSEIEVQEGMESESTLDSTPSTPEKEEKECSAENDRGEEKCPRSKLLDLIEAAPDDPKLFAELQALIESSTAAKRRNPDDLEHQGDITVGQRTPEPLPAEKTENKGDLYSRRPSWIMTSPKMADQSPPGAQNSKFLAGSEAYPQATEGDHPQNQWDRWDEPPCPPSKQELDRAMRIVTAAFGRQMQLPETYWQAPMAYQTQGDDQRDRRETYPDHDGTAEWQRRQREAQPGPTDHRDWPRNPPQPTGDPSLTYPTPAAETWRPARPPIDQRPPPRHPGHADRGETYPSRTARLDEEPPHPEPWTTAARDPEADLVLPPSVQRRCDLLRPPKAEPWAYSTSWGLASGAAGRSSFHCEDRARMTQEHAQEMPTVRAESVKSALVIGSILDLEVYQFDVQTAYLHAELDKKIFVKAPPCLRLLGT